MAPCVSMFSKSGPPTASRSASVPSDSSTAGRLALSASSATHDSSMGSAASKSGGVCACGVMRPSSRADRDA
eukprot:12502771-Alexandrium_andersonii.AAC.1